MSPGAEIAVHPLTPGRWADFEALMGPKGGAEGCWYLDEEAGPPRHVPAFAVDVVDTRTGIDLLVIVYFTAPHRVDFRELVKQLASEFQTRIEMRQIGARQEAGKIGGIGTCGRELCCSTFVSNFISVSTQAARVQEVALNPQKLAGQCGKLKCCLNYELSGYEDARRNFPKSGIPLRTVAGNANLLKTDVYRGIMWYAYEGSGGQALIPVPVERATEIMDMNQQGKLPDELIESAVLKKEEKALGYTDGAGEESLTRFEKSKSRKKKKHNHHCNLYNHGRKEQKIHYRRSKKRT